MSTTYGTRYIKNIPRKLFSTASSSASSSSASASANANANASANASRIQPSPHVPTHFIFGANTDVGKTVVTAGLVRASGNGNGNSNSNGTSSSSSTSSSTSAHYLKPLQCGGSDQGFIEKHAANEVTSCKTLFNWDTPASPHFAARKENKPISDKQVAMKLETCLSDLSTSSSSSPTSTSTSTSLAQQYDYSYTWIETAGGVLSPSSSSPDNASLHHAHQDDRQLIQSWGWVPQADLYQKYVDIGSVVLVGDGRLGGISATLSSLESLMIRGYDVVGMVLIETDEYGNGNQQALQEYANRKSRHDYEGKVSLFANPQASIISLPPLPPEPEPLMEWYESPEVKETLGSFVQDHLTPAWKDRLERMSI